MSLDIKDLKRLIRLCPKINLSNKDIKEIIESESYNNCIAKYTKKNPRNQVEEEIVVVTANHQEDNREIDNDEELAEHRTECEDDSCACKDD